MHVWKKTGLYSFSYFIWYHRFALFRNCAFFLVLAMEFLVIHLDFFPTSCENYFCLYSCNSFPYEWDWIHFLCFRAINLCPQLVPLGMGLWATSPVHLLWVFRDVVFLFPWAGHKLISSSQVVKISGVSYWCWPLFALFELSISFA
jgi:hypothetical protein